MVNVAIQFVLQSEVNRNKIKRLLWEWFDWRLQHGHGHGHSLDRFYAEFQCTTNTINFMDLSINLNDAIWCIVDDHFLCKITTATTALILAAGAPCVHIFAQQQPVTSVCVCSTCIEMYLNEKRFVWCLMYMYPTRWYDTTSPSGSTASNLPYCWCCSMLLTINRYV